MRLAWLPFLTLLSALPIPCVAQDAAAASAPETRGAGETVSSPDEVSRSDGISAAPAELGGEPLAPGAVPAEAIVLPEATPAHVAPEAVRLRTHGFRHAELAQVEQRIREIRSGLPSRAAPIILMAAGGVAAGASTFFLLVLRWELETDENGVRYRDSAQRATFRGLGVGALLGAGMLAGGGAWLGRVSRARNAHRPEVRLLKQRRKQLLRELRYGADLRGQHGQHYGLSLSARF